MAQNTIQPLIVSKAEFDGEVTVVAERPHFLTSIRLPDAVNSVAVGDPQLFQAEHSEHEPNLVFVKTVATTRAETNLLISTINRREASLLLVSNKEGVGKVDFVVKYRTAGSFLGCFLNPVLLGSEEIRKSRRAPENE